MITTLRKKFILVAMSSTFLVLAVIMGTVNILNYKRMVNRVDEVIAYLAENDGVFVDKFSEEIPKEEGNVTLSENGSENKQRKNPVGGPSGKKHFFNFNEETPFATRFFTAFLDEENEVTDVNIRKIAAVNEEEAKSYVIEAISSGKENGFLNHYRYGFRKTSEGSMLIFVDCRQEMDFFSNVLFLSISISVVGLLSVFLLVVIFSKIVFKPVEESDRKQKQFITNASHELKTPLTIIDANTEVIEMTSGENQWTKSTRNQIHRLADLTNNLVLLSRLDEKGTQVQKTVFSLSDAVDEVLGTFEVLAEQSEKTIIKRISSGISMTGDEKEIRQLISILMDNALKYSLPESDIHVNLKKNGRHILFSVENPCQELPKENMNVLFDRFYRLDSSRNSKTGGSGIGLSIAKAIVTGHKGKISATSSDRKSLKIQVELKEG